MLSGVYIISCHDVYVNQAPRWSYLIVYVPIWIYGAPVAAIWCEVYYFFRPTVSPLFSYDHLPHTRRFFLDLIYLISFAHSIPSSAS